MKAFESTNQERLTGDLALLYHSKCNGFISLQMIFYQIISLKGQGYKTKDMVNIFYVTKKQIKAAYMYYDRYKDEIDEDRKKLNLFY